MAFTQRALNRPRCLPLIQVQVEPQKPAIASPLVLTEELQRLMMEVEQLREETNTITCDCKDPNCPFQAPARSTDVPTDEESSMESDVPMEDSDEEDRSPDLGFGSMERIYKHTSLFSLPQVDLARFTTPLMSLTGADNLMSLSLTNIPRGIQKRADGTIVENDYPGFYCSNRKSKKKSRLTGICSMSHLNRLDVCSTEVPPMADCQVDQDGILTTGKDYTFSRGAPERKKIRSPRYGIKKISLEHVNSNPIISRRKYAVPASHIDLARHSSVPSIEKKFVDKIRSKFSQHARHSIAV